MNRERIRTSLIVALIAVGSLQCIGWAIGNKTIQGLGFMTAASPLPLVFTQVRGVETFAQDFATTLVFDDGQEIHLEITPKLYSQLGGAYNRRNTYGVAFSYGPTFAIGKSPQEQSQDQGLKMTDAIIRYGFCNDGPLRKSFAEELSTAKLLRITLHAHSRTAGRKSTWLRTVECKS